MENWAVYIKKSAFKGMLVRYFYFEVLGFHSVRRLLIIAPPDTAYNMKKEKKIVWAFGARYFPPSTRCPVHSSRLAASRGAHKGEFWGPGIKTELWTPSETQQWLKMTTERLPNQSNSMSEAHTAKAMKSSQLGLLHWHQGPDWRPIFFCRCIPGITICLRRLLKLLFQWHLSTTDLLLHPTPPIC